MSTELLNPQQVSGPDPASKLDRPVQGNFSREDLSQFASDDSEAGRLVGKMLAALFIYTLLAMSIVIWWSLCVGRSLPGAEARGGSVTGRVSAARRIGGLPHRSGPF